MRFCTQPGESKIIDEDLDVAYRFDLLLRFLKVTKSSSATRLKSNVVKLKGRVIDFSVVIGVSTMGGADSGIL